MALSKHRKFTAWAGLLAIWLAVLMPAISQSVQREQGRELSLSICLPGQASSQLSLDLTADPGHHPQTDHSLQACAYCGLLAAHAPLAHTVAGVQAGVAAWRPLAAPGAATVTAAAPEYPFAQPRAPPLLSA